ncbi:MAG: hypothetical protein ACE5HU_09330 [Acidobacteriota bacterium]
MKLSKTRVSAHVLAIAALTAVTASIAQSARTGPRQYDAARKIKVDGSVQSVRTIDCPKGQKGVELRIATGDKTYVAHVGPASWLKKLGFSIAKGDILEITGSVGPCGGRQVLKPRQITRGNVTVSLRTKNGEPLWSRTWTR